MVQYAIWNRIQSLFPSKTLTDIFVKMKIRVRVHYKRCHKTRDVNLNKKASNKQSNGVAGKETIVQFLFHYFRYWFHFPFNYLFWYTCCCISVSWRTSLVVSSSLMKSLTIQIGMVSPMMIRPWWLYMLLIGKREKSYQLMIFLCKYCAWINCVYRLMDTISIFMMTCYKRFKEEDIRGGIKKFLTTPRSKGARNFILIDNS